jgi:hypothetical protein
VAILVTAWVVVVLPPPPPPLLQAFLPFQKSKREMKDAIKLLVLLHEVLPEALPEV